MRQRTQQRAEALAAEQQAERIELTHLEAALEEGRNAMEEFVAAQEAASAAPAPEPAEAKPAKGDAPVGKCPWHNAAADMG